jgi:hypothetical protein
MIFKGRKSGDEKYLGHSSIFFLGRRYQYMIDGIYVYFEDVDDYINFREKIKDRLDLKTIIEQSK